MKVIFLSGAGLKEAGVWGGSLSVWQIETKCSCRKWYHSGFPLRQGICKLLLVDFLKCVSPGIHLGISNITPSDYSLYPVVQRDVKEGVATHISGAGHPPPLLEPSMGTWCLCPRLVKVAAAFLLNQQQCQQRLCTGLTQVPTAKSLSPLWLTGLRVTSENTHTSLPSTLTSTCIVADPQVQAWPPWLSDIPAQIPDLLTCSMVPKSPAVQLGAHCILTRFLCS